MLAAWNFCSTETRTDFKGLGGRDREHSVTQLGLEFVKDRFAKSSGHIADHTGDSTTDGIIGIFCPNDAL